MNSKLFVGNLAFQVTENDLQDLFQQYGPVTDVNLVMDRASGRSRGFAFVTMATPEGAQAAMEALNNREVSGRNLKVSEARPKTQNPSPREDSWRDDRGGSRPWRGRRNE
jgi:RNA recognition motif-containing protein